MARARNIKPGFFANELLVELPFETRLLFIGLWTLADKAGRLEDRPKRIKMELFPADSVDVGPMLTDLANLGFITRYVADGVSVIQVVNWDKHQSPHHTERNSTLPARLVNGDATVNQQKQDGGCRPDSLIPDSGFTDSLIPDSSEANASGAVAPSMTPSEQVWVLGVPQLKAKGTADKQARSFLGGLVKKHGAEAVCEALQACARASPVEPVAWLTACLSSAKKPPKEAPWDASRNKTIAALTGQDRKAEVIDVYANRVD